MISKDYNTRPYYLIPARLGSKGLPLKNRALFKYTAESIKHLNNWVIVSTDDPEIMRMAQEYDFLIDARPSELAQDDTSMKDVIKHIADKFHLEDIDTLIVLYLTYPERTWDDIADAYLFYLRYLLDGKTESLLCRLELDKSPYLYLEENGIYGKQLTPHNYYRRQDYPVCFELSHFVSIVLIGAINNLNDNLYNDQTVFYKICKKIVDVDTKKDLDSLNGRLRNR